MSVLGFVMFRLIDVNVYLLKIVCLSGYLVLVVFPNKVAGILGPILFLIFINDLPDCIQYSSILLCADDAKIFKCINCMLDCVLFQRDLDSMAIWCDLDSMAIWCDLWQLKLNILKCM